MSFRRILLMVAAVPSVPLIVNAAQLDDYTLFSNADLVLSDRVAVRNGLSGSNTYTELGIDDTVSGSVLSKNNMLMRDRARVLGNVTVSGTLMRNSQAYVSGTVLEHATVPALSIPQSTLSPGTGDITVSAGATTPLYPGAYRTVQIGANAGVYLTAGSYNFSALRLDPDVTLYFDCTHGPVQINVLNELKISDRDKLIISAGAFNPADVAIYTHQTATLQIGTDCRIEAIITAPRSPVTIASRSIIKGKLRANRITLSADVKVEHCTFVDSDRDGMADAWEVANGLNPNVNDAGLDPDADNFNNALEFTCLTDPRRDDTDNDQLDDGEEYAYWENRSDGIGWGADVERRQMPGGMGDGLPNIRDDDSDDDGIPDGVEVAGWNITVNGETKRVTADPANIDSDGDGITDEAERAGYDIRIRGASRHVSTDPANRDTDNDGLDDHAEKADGILDPSAEYSFVTMDDPKWQTMVNHLGEWAKKPLSRRLDPEYSSSSTSIRDIRVSFHDNTNTVINQDMGMGFYFSITPEDAARGHLQFLLEFIGSSGDIDGKDCFTSISYSNQLDPADPGYIEEHYTGPDADEVIWTIDDPSRFVPGDYYFHLTVHYDKDAGETPRVLAMGGKFEDWTDLPISYFEPGDLGNYPSPLHVNLLVAGDGTNPSYFRGETPLVKSNDPLAQYSYIDSVKVSDFNRTTIRTIGRKAFNGYGFQYELGILPAYTDPVSFFLCSHVEFDWIKDPNSIGHCVVHIDEAGNDWKELQFTYDARNQTQEYYCWASGLATDTAVVRRSHALRAVVGNWRLQDRDAALTIRNRAGTDVTSSFTISKEAGMEYAAYDGTQATWRENWIIQTSSSIPLGKYTVTARCGTWSTTADFYVIFDILQAAMGEGEYRGYCYSEDYDGTHIPFDNDLGRDEYERSDGSEYPLDPFSKVVTDYAVALADGKTSEFQIRNLIRRFSGQIIKGCWDVFGCAASMQATAKPEVLITNSYVTLAEALSGNISSDHNLPGQCMNFASLSVGLSRAIGIPSRMATGGGSGFVDATATWIPNVNTFQPDYSELPWWWHVWTEAWLENPPSGSDKWYVFDGTDYVGSPYGSSASRRDYGSKWLPSTGRVTIFDFDAEAEVIEVTNLYR